MHTITILVGDLEGDRLPVQIVPNDGAETHIVLSALQIATQQITAQLIQEAEARGYESAKADQENTFNGEEETDAES